MSAGARENSEAAEISLSHRAGGSVVAGYARSDMLEMPRALMEQYGGGGALGAWPLDFKGSPKEA